MPRATSKFVCQQCGHESVKWMGRCPDCGQWNTLIETVTPATGSAARASARRGPHLAAVPLPAVRPLAEKRLSTGSAELDRVLGGGLVPGAVILMGGEPGIGKSSVLLDVSGHLAEQAGDVLYVSAEESMEQVKLRAERFGITSEHLLLLAETDITAIIETIEQLRPSFVVVDSIQTVASPESESAPGSVSQVRECALRLTRVAKTLHIPICLIGHVTKEGTVAGPRTLEHMVDAVLYLEGERFHTYRLLRGVKNRFGATHEVGVFEMTSTGMHDVPNPSGLFLAEQHGETNGSAVVVSMEGTRPLLVEVQALATTATLGAPRVSANGFDRNRLTMLLAVLIKRVGLGLGTQDVYVNIAGGFTLDEPAVDLGVAIAVASSFLERDVERGTVLLGEIGLGGELRPVPRTQARVREAEKLGFTRCIIPVGGVGREDDLPAGGIEIIQARNVREVIDSALTM